MTKEIAIATFLAGKGETVKVYDKATTLNNTTIYSTGGYPAEMEGNGGGYMESTIQIRYEGNSGAEIESRMDRIRNYLINSKQGDISEVIGVRLMSDKLFIGKNEQGAYMFSQNYAVMQNL